MEEDRGAPARLGGQVEAGALGEAVVVAAAWCGDVGEHCLTAVLGVSQVGEHRGVAVAPVGNALLVELSRAKGGGRGV